MDKEQAKEILWLYRASDSKNTDPETAAALLESESNPELKQWFDEHRQFQTKVREKLRQAQPPKHLKAAILSGRPAATHKILQWRSPALLAIAASIVLLLSLTMYFMAPNSRNDFAAYRNRMAKFALREYRMDIANNDTTQIRDYLASKKSPADYVVSPELDKLPRLGCAALKWQNHPVSLLCFRLGKEDLLWLFVIDQSSVKNGPSTPRSQFEQINKLATATWSEKGKTYILAGFGDKALLEKYL